MSDADANGRRRRNSLLRHNAMALIIVGAAIGGCLLLVMSDQASSWFMAHRCVCVALEDLRPRTSETS